MGCSQIHFDMWAWCRAVLWTVDVTTYWTPFPVKRHGSIFLGGRHWTVCSKPTHCFSWRMCIFPEISSGVSCSVKSFTKSHQRQHLFSKQQLLGPCKPTWCIASLHDVLVAVLWVMQLAPVHGISIAEEKILPISDETVIVSLYLEDVHKYSDMKPVTFSDDSLWSPSTDSCRSFCWGSEKQLHSALLCHVWPPSLLFHKWWLKYMHAAIRDTFYWNGCV